MWIQPEHKHNGHKAVLGRPESLLRGVFYQQGDRLQHHGELGDTEPGTSYTLKRGSWSASSRITCMSRARPDLAKKALAKVESTDIFLRSVRAWFSSWGFGST